MFQNISETLTLIASAVVQWLSYKTPLPKDFIPKRILVVKLDHLGDVLLATPVFSNLSQAYPDAELHALAGAWSRVFCEALDISIPIAPARGQMLAVTTIRRLLQRPINSSKGALVPRADGSVHVGATVEHVGFDKRNTPEAIADLLERGTAVVPTLSDGRVERMWSGFRPFCEDGLPVIGALLDCENVSVAAGHFTMGITGSPITAKIIKELIVDGRWDKAMEIFSPARFVEG